MASTTIHTLGFPTSTFNGNLKHAAYIKPFATNAAAISLLETTEFRQRAFDGEIKTVTSIDPDTDAYIFNQGLDSAGRNQFALTYLAPNTHGTINGTFLPANTPSAVSITLSGVTYTPAQLWSGLVRRNLTNPGTDFFPSALDLFPLSRFSDVHVGQYIDVSIHNYGASAITLAPSADGSTTFAVALIDTVSAGTVMRYRIVASVVADDADVPLLDQTQAGGIVAAVVYTM